MSNTSPEETSLIRPMPTGDDMSYLSTLDIRHNDIISDQNLTSHWLDGSAIMSPAVIPNGNQQVVDDENMQSAGGPALWDLMQADLYVSSAFRLSIPPLLVF